MSRLPRLAALCALLLCVLAAPAQADTPFDVAYSKNTTGDIAVIGNTLLSCATGATGCADARNGTGTLNNNNWPMAFVDVDSDGATFNSSSATLSLLAGRTILNAQLVWGANTKAGDTVSGVAGADAPDAALKDRVRFTTPAGTTQVVASQLDTDATNGSSQDRYGAVADVTSLVQAGGDGVYAVANVQAGRGGDRYAGWALVVTYAHPSLEPHNLTVFKGYVPVSSGNPKTITVNGFQTPKAAPFTTKLGLVSYEGDLGLVGDQASVGTTELANAANPLNNTFNSTIATPAASRTPGYVNQLGFDADEFSIDGALAPNQTSAQIPLETDSDRYIPNLVTFVSDLRSPRFLPTESVAPSTGGKVEPGDVLTYTIVAKNEGDDHAKDVVVERDLDPDVQYVPGSLTVDGAPVTDATNDDTGEITGGTLKFPLGVVNEGATKTITFQVKVPEAIATGTPITGTTKIDYSGTTMAGLDLEGEGSSSVVVVRPDLAVSATHGTLTRGDSATYELTAANVGQGGTHGTTTLAATFPAGLSVTGVTGTGWSCLSTSSTVSCTRSDRAAAGASFPKVFVTVDVAESATTLDVDASVDGDQDLNAANDAVTSPGNASSTADLRVTAVATGDAGVGKPQTWTYTIHNDGPSSATGVEGALSIPAGLVRQGSVSSSQGSCAAAGPCTIGTLAKGATATVTLVAVPGSSLAGLTTDPRLTVSATTTDPDATDDQGGDPVAVRPAVDLMAGVTAAPTVTAGTAAQWDVTLRNDGPSTSSATLAVTLPAGLASPTVELWNGTACPVVSGVATCPAVTLGAGVQRTATVRGSVPAGATAGSTLAVTARGTTSSATDELDATDDEATATSTVTGRAELSVGPTAALPALTIGQGTDTAFPVGNTGPSEAHDVVLEVALPAGLGFDAAGSDVRCVVVGGKVRCALGTLAVGQTVAPVVRLVAMRDGAGASRPVKATVDATETDTDPSDDAVTATATIAPAVELSVKADGAPQAAGREVSYRLKVANAGPNEATDVTVEDVLPEGAVYESATVEGGECTIGGGRVTCRLATLPVGQERTISLRVKVSPQQAGRAFQTAPGVGSAQAALRAPVLEAPTLVVEAERAESPAPAKVPAACVSRRRFAIHWTVPRGSRPTSFRVVVNGKTVKRLGRSARRWTVDLRGRTPSTVRVQVVATGRSGRKVGTARVYRTCLRKAESALPTIRLGKVR
ncbi:DUF11 domain-containing protein [Conexibacter sp. SYSU D00693]|uniref:COG1361 S-layer family protein n=1 Tax=Conexibacter sp. SYSU D00693 TaxID=2812560 RepID=UPI00196AA27E|nr:DUF11 domain-containing protein [Conexibacter sp. SYSU D00693]